MRMLTDRQIKIYTKAIKNKHTKKKLKNKAKSRLTKDFNRYSQARIDIMKNKMDELVSTGKIKKPA